MNVPDDSSHLRMVSLFILERTGATQLSYSDYGLIETWAGLFPDLRMLLLILDDLLPQGGGRIRLQSLNGKVVAAARQSAQLQGRSQHC